MARTEDTIEQLRFLAENWHRFSSWTRLQIIVTIWWYVKVQRPMLRFSKRLNLGDEQRLILEIALIVILFILCIAALAPSLTELRPHYALMLALMSAGILVGFSLVQNGR